MSTIPAGLRSDLMRARMEDKATIQHTGSLYMGGSTPVVYKGISGGQVVDISGYATEELQPGPAGYPLVSNGAGRPLSYQQIDVSTLGERIITRDKLGNGTVCMPSGYGAVKYFLDIMEDPADDEILLIKFYPEEDED